MDRRGVTPRLPTPIDPEVLPMCSPITCTECGKTTWQGCGQHIEEALAGVPHDQRCQGH